MNQRKKRREEQSKRRIESFVDSRRREYREQWGISSQFFESIGAYEWMCKPIVGNRFALEVGCGTGESTVALAKRGHRIVVVEENPYCCKAAAETLLEKNIEVDLILRGKVRGTQANSYDQLYGPIQIQRPSSNVTIVEGDLLFDNNLKQWLESISPFDAVVCWMIGTNESRQLISNYPNLPWKSNGEYRLRVENKVYELAGKVLGSGGILNSVDRAELPQGDMKELLEKEDFESHIDQASVTDLEVDPLSQRYFSYDHTEIVGGKAMEWTPGSSGRIPKTIQFALRSINAFKP